MHQKTGKAARIIMGERYKYGEKEEFVHFGFSSDDIEFADYRYMSGDWICAEFCGVFVPKRGDEKVGLFMDEWDLYIVNTETGEVTEVRGEIDRSEYPGCEEYFALREEHIMKKYWDEFPEVDEPLTEEEKEAIARAEKDNEYVTLEELKRELDL